jgi:hypothetical protein
MRLKAVLLAVALLLSVPAAFSQNQATDKTLVTIRPQMAMQGLDPMNPTGVHVIGTGSSGDAIMRQITIANYTTKTVTSLEYAYRVSTPVGCTDSTLPVRWETASADNINLAPGGEAQIDAPRSLSASGSSKQLAEAADRSKTPVVLVTVGVLRVNFSDGSTWADDEALQHNTFDNGRAEKENGCHSPTPAEIRAKQMRAKAAQTGAADPQK